MTADESPKRLDITGGYRHGVPYKHIFEVLAAKSAPLPGEALKPPLDQMLLPNRKPIREATKPFLMVENIK